MRPDALLPVYLAKDIPSPCLFGLLRPSIYISPQAAEDESTLSHVLTHEYCHFRQWDHIWSLVRTLCLSLYWFHPLVWAAAAYSRSDCELACDELAVATLGEEPKAGLQQNPGGAGAGEAPVLPPGLHRHHYGLGPKQYEGADSYDRQIPQEPLVRRWRLSWYALPCW